MHNQIFPAYKKPRLNLTGLPLLLLTGLLLGLLLAMAKPASAADPLGSVTNANQVSCESVQGSHGVPNGTCFKALVSCPGVADIGAAVKVNQPRGSSIGTVLFTIGGGGTAWYDIHFTFGKTAVEDVVNAGYTTVQFNFEFAPSGRGNEPFIGWLTGPGGPRALACRWATLAQWAHDTLRQGNTPFCATGNSGGSGAAGYALAHYGMSTTFNMLEETSGPPFSRIDHGCLCNTPPMHTPCRQGPIAECYGGNAAKFLDPAYNNHACSQAEQTHHSRFEQLFLQDSLNSADATYSYPNTDMHFLFGGLDNGPSVPLGMEWVSLITGKTKPTVDCVADAPHEIPNVLDGATKIAQDIINFCH